MKKLVYLVVFLISLTSLYSQHPEWTQYTCGKYATALVEDGDFIWIGTTGGLVKLNKLTQEMTFFNNANSGLPNNKVNSLALDSSKNLWIGTRDNLSKFDGTEWTNYHNIDSVLPLILSIQDIEVDKDNNVWAATYLGLAKISGNEMVLFNSKNSDFPFDRVSTIAFDTEDNLWISDYYNGRFAKFKGGTWIVYSIPDSLSLYGRLIQSLVVDNVGAVFLAIEGGILRFFEDEWKIYKSNAWIELWYVKTLKIDKDGNLWAGGIDCLAKYFPESDNWSNLRYNLDGFDNLMDIMPSDEGTVWLADKNDGVAKYISKDSILYFNPSNSGLTHQTVTYIAIEDSIKWIAPNTFGLTKFDGQKWNTDYSLPVDFIKHIAIDKEKNKWLATDYSYLVKFSDKDTVVFDSLNSGIPSPRLNWIAIDNDNNKWIATEWFGLVKFDKTNCTVYDTANSDLPTDDLSCVAIDSKGNKWIGTYYGLVKFDNEKFIVYDTSNSELPVNIINCIKIDENDVIWVGTENGLVRIEDDKWDIYNDSLAGFPENKITCINIDKSYNIWVGFEKSGITEYKDVSWKFYSVSNSGLPNDYINCIAVDSIGKIWVATDGGIGVLDESVINVEESKPNKNLLPISNFPNPFYESTKFTFYLVQSANVNLTIYNSLGQEIAVLCDGWKQAGEHEINFNGSNLNSGVYYYKFSVGSENHYGKVVLIR